jgi:hypothetical protein
LKELVRVAKPGAWIEVVEGNLRSSNCGPNLAKIFDWFQGALATRGIHGQVTIDPGLPYLMEQAGIVNIQYETLNIPVYKDESQLGEHFKQDSIRAWRGMGAMAMKLFGISKEEVDETIRLAQDETDEYKSFHTFYFARGQKKEETIDA